MSTILYLNSLILSYFHWYTVRLPRFHNFHFSNCTLHFFLSLIKSTIPKLYSISSTVSLGNFSFNNFLKYSFYLFIILLFFVNTILSSSFTYHIRNFPKFVPRAHIWDDRITHLHFFFSSYSFEYLIKISIKYTLAYQYFNFNNILNIPI